MSSLCVKFSYFFSFECANKTIQLNECCIKTVN